MNQTVISERQARAITGGRKPLVPVEYEEACKQLEACINLDEAKYWSDKSDALAAWAKIYHDDKVSFDAKRLKLRAFRRMGELAGELRPHKCGGTKKGGIKIGSEPGPRALLIEKGLSIYEAAAARRLSSLVPAEFDKVISAKCPPSPTTIAMRGRVEGRTEAYKLFVYGEAFPRMRAFCRAHDAQSLAKGLLPDEGARLRKQAIEISEWLDAFEQALPK